MPLILAPLPRGLLRVALLAVRVRLWLEDARQSVGKAAAALRWCGRSAARGVVVRPGVLLEVVVLRYDGVLGTQCALAGAHGEYESEC